MSNLKQLLKEFRNQYKTDVASLGVHEEDPLRISSGIFSFDLATGGGIPLGRCSLVYGPEASMKTTLCLKILARAQKMFPKKKAVFVDVEGHFSKPWATKMGVDCDDLVYVIPDTAEQFVDVVESIMYASDVSLVIVDSLAALVTTHELNSEAEKAMVGTQGILINKFYRKMSRALSLARREGQCPTLLCINQIRSKVGQVYGNPETMPGGHAFKFASSMTIRVYGKDKIVKEIHLAMPAYKEVKFIVKKHKVPIVAPTGVFLLALQSIANPKLEVGESYDWNTVLSYLKACGLLTKNETENGGWDLWSADDGSLVLNYDTQESLRKHMQGAPEIDALVKQDIIKAVLGGKVVVE